MIKHLYIKNFVLIDELNLDFEGGFSAFTGETGAGKSILIDAISVLCAERASTSYIQKGKDKALIEGTFTLSKRASALLKDAGFDTDEETTFTREIMNTGKSTARIDHRIVTLSLLRDCLKNEMDIHGQRDNAYLLNTASHIHLLDAYLNDKEQLKAVKDAYDVYSSLQHEKDKAMQEVYNENDLEYFNYEINEIDEADLKSGEDTELEEKEQQYQSTKESFDKYSQIISLYDDSLSDSLYELNHAVQSLKDNDSVTSIQTQINDAYYSISDAMEQLHNAFDNMNMSEDDINDMEERLFTIQKLKRKYGHTIEDILAQKEQLQKQVNAYTHRSEYLKEMDGKIANARTVYNEKAGILSTIRTKGALKLDKEIAVQLHDLMLTNAKFHTDIRTGEPSSFGNDRIEFLISMNKGEDMKSLAKTASGGELSRLMLGLKVIFTRLQGIRTVIFDEIDTGVSGPVATSIGRKMKALSKDCQVFSVTHLAQVAACADSNYLVSKTDSGNQTRTRVNQLDESHTIDQLALIASGEVTDTSRKAAEELFRRNQA
jgi:DNA repair protein RecN (Recombination protein N)